jgi:hypothetical protein
MNPIDAISTDRGWNPLQPGDTMHVCIDGVDYKIHRRDDDGPQDQYQLRDRCESLHEENEALRKELKGKQCLAEHMLTENDGLN